MPSAPAWAPRTMFPPPTTSAISTPVSRMEAISSVRLATTPGSIPNPRSPARASPESLRTMRRKRRPVLRSDLVAGESPDDDVFAKSLDRFADDIRHLSIRILDVGLIEQADVLIPLLELAGRDLLDDFVRLARVACLLTVNLHLPLDQSGVHALAIHRHRVGSRNLHRQ